MAGIVIVADASNGALNDVSLELLAKGRELATALGQPLTAVLAGDGVSALASSLQGADRVLLLEDAALRQFTPDAHEQALGSALKQLQPRLIMIGNTTAGMDLAAGLASRLGWPLVAYCTDLRVEGSDLIAVAQLYGGKLFAEVELGQQSTIVSVIPGSFAAAAAGGNGAIEQAAVSIDNNRTAFKELIAPESGVDIRKAPTLVSVGRGIGGPENLEIVQELAAALGAELAASRPVVDSGWLPKARQVGKSGQTVKPKLYLAVGISGAPEHLQGMKDADFIVAINTDPGAPIFEVAHLGVVADALEFVPALTERVRAGA